MKIYLINQVIFSKFFFIRNKYLSESKSFTYSTVGRGSHFKLPGINLTSMLWFNKLTEQLKSVQAAN